MCTQMSQMSRARVWVAAHSAYKHFHPISSALSSDSCCYTNDQFPPPPDASQLCSFTLTPPQHQRHKSIASWNPSVDCGSPCCDGPSYNDCYPNQSRECDHHSSCVQSSYCSAPAAADCCLSVHTMPHPPNHQVSSLSLSHTKTLLTTWSCFLMYYTTRIILEALPIEEGTLTSPLKLTAAVTPVSH